MIRKIIIILLIILMIIQFIRPAKNISTALSANDIRLHYAVPTDVLNILKRSCNDCHSNNTVYPWYFNIQPVAWWLKDHIDEGKKELNFSEFASYPVKKQYHKLKSVIEQVKKDEMPLNYYLWIHKDAILSQEQKTILLKWADSLQSAIKVKNNLPDEPERRGE